MIEGESAAEAGGRRDIQELLRAYYHESGDRKTKPSAADRIQGAQVLIATVPDPAHTRLALRFDREIDVLEDEFQQLGWTYDSSWLPWDSTTYKAPDRWEARGFDGRLQDVVESLPGVLLFRRDATAGNGTGSDPLIVLLVGEKPTGGINAAQFAQALTYWRQPSTLLNEPACKGKKCKSPDTLRVLGPSFSGSLPSLDTTLRGYFAPWPSKEFSIRIASGTVSDGLGLRALAEPYQVAPKPTAQAKPPDVSSFFPPSVELAQGLSCFLQARNSELKIAQVREKESSFGSIDSKGKRGQGERTPCKNGAGTARPLGNFHYPREISQLRRAYEQNGIVGFSDSAAGTPRNQLQLSAAQDERGSDSVDMFAGPLDAVALEADLAGLTHELATENYSVVLLSGTDVMDEIFVARYLSQHAPNLTVVIEDTDQLFLHEGADASLNNIYVASPWPLLWQNQRWSARPGEAEVTSVRFASAGNQGIAAALHHLLCDSGETAACRADKFGGYRSPFAGLDPKGTAVNRPPVWLSLIEHGSFLPVALLDLAPPAGSVNLPPIPAGSDGTQTTAPTAGIHTVTGFPVKVLATTIFCLLLWHGWACIRCRLDRSIAWTYALAEREHHRIRLLIKSSLSLAGSFALALLFIPGSPGFQVQSAYFQGCLIAGQLLGVAVSSLSIRKLAMFEEVRFPWNATITLGAVCLGALLAVDYTLWPMLAPAGSRSEYLFFLYRAASPFSGGSPAMPLLLMTAAAVLLLHSVFSRLAFFGHRIPKLPDGFDYVRCPSSCSMERLTDLLANVKDRHRWWAALACGGVMVLLMRLSEHHSILSLGTGPFDTVMTVVLVLAGGIMLQNLYIAWLSWRLLRQKLLIPLKQSPLRWGFNWVKDFSWRRIWRSSKTLSSTQVFDYLLRLLQASSRQRGSSTGPRYYERICQLYLAADKGASPHDFTEGVKSIQYDMKYEAQVRLKKLLVEWNTDRGPLTGSKEVNRGVHLLQDVSTLKGKERLGILRRMGDEEFVALIYVGYISMVLIQIRQRILTAATLYILLLWSLTNYPWMYRHTILLLLVALFAVLTVVTLMVYSGMHRDEILSRTTETETGKLDGGFVTRVLAVLGVPLLTLVASQFPEVSSFIFSWLQPSLSKLP